MNLVAMWEIQVSLGLSGDWVWLCRGLPHKNYGSIILILVVIKVFCCYVKKAFSIKSSCYSPTVPKKEIKFLILLVRGKIEYNYIKKENIIIPTKLP